MNKQTLSNSYSEILSLISTSDNKVVLPTTLHDIYWYFKKPKEYAVISHFTPDGMPLVFFQRLMGNRVERVYGPDILKKSLEKLSSKKHVFVASSDVLDQMKERFVAYKDTYLYIPVGYRETVSELISDDQMRAIQDHSPDSIWLGIGSPKQVLLASYLREKLNKVNIICVGAGLDFLVNKQVMSPKYIQSIGLEWLFRFIREPARLWKRYLIFSIIGLIKLPVFMKQINR